MTARESVSHHVSLSNHSTSCPACPPSLRYLIWPLHLPWQVLAEDLASAVHAAEPKAAPVLAHSPLHMANLAAALPAPSAVNPAISLPLYTPSQLGQIGITTASVFSSFQQHVAARTARFGLCNFYVLLGVKAFDRHHLAASAEKAAMSRIINYTPERVRQLWDQLDPHWKPPCAADVHK